MIADKADEEVKTVPDRHVIMEVFAEAEGLTRDLDTLDTDGFKWIGSDLVKKREQRVIANSAVLEFALSDPEYQDDALALCASLLFDRGYRHLPSLAARIQSIASQHIDEIVDDYGNRKENFLVDIVNISQALVVHESSQEKKSTIQASVLELIGNKIARDPSSILSAELGFLLEHGNDEMQLVGRGLTMDAFGVTRVDDKRSDVVDGRHYPKAMEISRRYLRDYLDSVGLPGEAIFVSWMKNRSNQDVHEDGHNEMTIYHTVHENLIVINELKHLDVNVSLLNKLYGISNFARYPVRLLERQAKEPKRPCIFMFYPTDDYNGGIYDTRDTIETFYNKLPQNIDVIVAEVGDIDSLKKMTLKFKSLFGRGVHGIVAGHGASNGDGLTLGAGGQYYKSHLSRISFAPGPPPAEGVGELFDECFEPDAEILFISCSTGDEMPNKLGGLARFATRHSRLTYIGPEVPTGASSIEGVLRLGKVKHLNVAFDKGRAMKYRDNQLVT